MMREGNKWRPSLRTWRSRWSKVTGRDKPNSSHSPDCGPVSAIQAVAGLPSNAALARAERSWSRRVEEFGRHDDHPAANGGRRDEADELIDEVVRVAEHLGRAGRPEKVCPGRA